MGKLAEFHREYERIISNIPKGEKQDRVLARLMDRIAKECSIPLRQDLHWEQEHRAVIALYRIVSRSRSMI